MGVETEVGDLLLRWEQLRGQGQAVSAEGLCPDRPDLLPELRWRIRALEFMDSVLRPAASLVSGESSDPSSPLTTHHTYEVLRPHAKGGVGEVFVARDAGLGRE